HERASRVCHAQQGSACPRGGAPPRWDPAANGSAPIQETVAPAAAPGRPAVPRDNRPGQPTRIGRPAPTPRRYMRKRRTGCQEVIMSLPMISPTELKQRYAAGADVDLIDVRTPVEYRELHVEFARNIPLDRLDAAELFRLRGGRAGEPLYVICGSG